MAASKRKVSPAPPDHEPYEVKRRHVQSDLPDDISATLDSTSQGHDDEQDLGQSTRPTSTVLSESGGSRVTKLREKSYVCDYPGCNKAYNRPVRLAEHHRSHTGERPILCDHAGCGKSFSRRSHLKHHLNTQHEQIRNFPCDHPGCDKTYATGQRLRIHYQKQHAGDRQVHRCTGFPPCDQEFRKEDTLQRHITSVHLLDKPYMCDGIDSTTNQVCTRKFKTSYALVQHQEREHGGDRFWCTRCPPAPAATVVNDLSPAAHADSPEDPRGLGFPTRAQLQQHMKQVHRPTCLDCDFVAKSAAQLAAHRDIAHTSLDARRVYACTYTADCDRAFTSKGNLAIHIRSAHESKRYICGRNEVRLGKNTETTWDCKGACGRAFVSRQSLVRHVRGDHLYLPPPPPAAVGLGTGTGTVAVGKVKRQARKARLESVGLAARVGRVESTQVAGAAGTNYTVADHDATCPVAAGKETYVFPPTPATRDGGTASALPAMAGLLTGVGYADTRRLACVVPQCAQRFRRSRDLEVHLEMTHCFDRSCAAEAAMEQVALHGGDFWVGVDVDDDHDDHDDHDGLVEASEATLAARLDQVFGRDGNDGVDGDDDNDDNDDNDGDDGHDDNDGNAWNNGNDGNAGNS